MAKRVTNYAAYAIVVVLAVTLIDHLLAGDSWAKSARVGAYVTVALVVFHLLRERFGRRS